MLELHAPLLVAGTGKNTPGARRFASAPAGFAAISLVVLFLAAALAGWAPLGFSIVTVFLFAGPHNWFEFRYFLSRMPAHWGPLRGYFTLAIGGVAGLTAAFALLPWLGQRYEWNHDEWIVAIASWNSVLLLWIATLITLRSRQSPRRDWSWAWPAAFLLMATAWLFPQAWDLGLVYLHPLIAMWFLDREIGARKPEWRRTYRLCLALVPALLAVLWWRLSDAPSLPGDDVLSVRIARHAGAGILDQVSSHLLVSTHTFLEMLHYGIWLLAIPLVGLRTAPWKLAQVPLAKRSTRWRLGVYGVLGLGCVAVLVLWGGFLADYPATRDLYFTLAIAHVLAEAPFLLRTI